MKSDDESAFPLCPAFGKRLRSLFTRARTFSKLAETWRFALSCDGKPALHTGLARYPMAMAFCNSKLTSSDLTWRYLRRGRPPGTFQNEIFAISTRIILAQKQSS